VAFESIGIIHTTGKAEREMMLSFRELENVSDFRNAR
jgi:hypothetical protein